MTERQRHGFAALAVALSLACVALALPVSAGERPVVVELFTSQGCSSCPPADTYLSELAKRSDVIALAYHVDYWNYIGWNDPLSSKQMTQRQKDYQRGLNQRYVYTPEMVVNGSAHEVGSDRHGVEKLIAAARKTGTDGPAVTIRLGDDGMIAAHVAGVAKPLSGEPATVWLVKYDRPHETTVERGENEGRKLVDYQAVRTLHELGRWTGAPLDVEYPLNDPDDPGNGGCAVLVQRGIGGPIIAAGMLAFPPGS